MQVADRLWELDEVYYAALSTGDCDVSTSVAATDVASLQTFVTQTLHSIPGVWKTKTFVIMQVIKQSGDWQFPARLP